MNVIKAALETGRTLVGNRRNGTIAPGSTGTQYAAITDSLTKAYQQAIDGDPAAAQATLAGIEDWSIAARGLHIVGHTDVPEELSGEYVARAFVTLEPVAALNTIEGLLQAVAIDASQHGYAVHYALQPQEK